MLNPLPTLMVQYFSAFSFRRTIFKSLREEVQELEQAHVDPAKAVLNATRKK